MITRIISGGQTGADRAALGLAKELGLDTGGWAPKNYRTEDGSDYTLREDFDLLEHPSADYPDRTYANVLLADATIWFGEADRAGYLCTRRAALHYGKPFLENPTGESLRTLLRTHWSHVSVLNIAGTRRSRNPTIVDLVRQTLTVALERP